MNSSTQDTYEKIEKFDNLNVQNTQSDALPSTPQRMTTTQSEPLARFPTLQLKDTNLGLEKKSESQSRATSRSPTESAINKQDEQPKSPLNNPPPIRKSALITPQTVLKFQQSRQFQQFLTEKNQEGSLENSLSPTPLLGERHSKAHVSQLMVVSKKPTSLIKNRFASDEKASCKMDMHSTLMRVHMQSIEKHKTMNPVEQMISCVKQHNLHELQELFIKYPDWLVDCKDETTGDTLLCIAVITGQKAIVKYLLDKGSKVNYQNNEGNTPLHLAMAFSHHEIADILITRGALQNIRNRQGKTPWEVRV